MKIKKEWIWNSIGFSPIILFGLIGWILDWVFGVTIWPLYWALGFLGCAFSGMVFAIYVLRKRMESSKDEESKEDNE